MATTMDYFNQWSITRDIDIKAPLESNGLAAADHTRTSFESNIVTGLGRKTQSFNMSVAHEQTEPTASELPAIHLNTRSGYRPVSMPIQNINPTSDQLRPCKSSELMLLGTEAALPVRPWQAQTAQNASHYQQRPASHLAPQTTAPQIRRSKPNLGAAIGAQIPTQISTATPVVRELPRFPLHQQRTYISPVEMSATPVHEHMISQVVFTGAHKSGSQAANDAAISGLPPTLKATISDRRAAAEPDALSQFIAELSAHHTTPPSTHQHPQSRPAATHHPVASAPSLPLSLQAGGATPHIPPHAPSHPLSPAQISSNAARYTAYSTPSAPAPSTYKAYRPPAPSLSPLVIPGSPCAKPRVTGTKVHIVEPETPNYTAFSDDFSAVSDGDVMRSYFDTPIAHDRDPSRSSFDSRVLAMEYRAALPEFDRGYASW